MQKLWVEWILSPVRSQWQIHFAVLTLAVRWIFFSMMQLGYVTYNVYLHYSSDTENISLKFSFLKIRCPSYTFNFTYFFFMHTSYKGELWLLSSWMFFLKGESFNLHRNLNKSTNQTIDKISKLSTNKRKCCFVTRTKSFFTYSFAFSMNQSKWEIR